MLQAILLTAFLLLSGCAGSARYDRGFNRGVNDYARYEAGKKNGYSAYGLGYFLGLSYAINTNELKHSADKLSEELKKLQELSGETTPQVQLP